MELNTLHVVISIPIGIMLYVVYETVKYNSERKG